MQIKYIDKIYEDLCYKSIELLEEEVHKYLLVEHGVKEPWILDSINGTRLPPKAKQVEVVFFGSYIQRFLESGNWPIESARFWVLTKSVKRVLVEQFNIREEFINIIPRNKLFITKTIPKQFPTIIDEIDLVYAGRISESKNIDALLYTVYHLQDIYKLKVKLFLIGNVDNMSNIYSMKEDIFSYQDHLNDVVDSLDWKIKPQFLEEMGSKEWIKFKFHNPVFITFSNFISEDFGVSIAQAAQVGWRSIVSDWGGHKDLDDNMSIKVPHSYLVENSGFTHLLKERTKSAAKFVHDGFINNNDTKNEPKITVTDNQFISIEEIDIARKKFIGNNGGAISLYLLRGQMNKFKSQECGEKFFSKLSSIFSEDPLCEIDTFVITDDLSGTVPGTKEIYTKILSEELTQDKRVEFIPLNKVMWKTNLFKIKNANKIIIGFWTPKLISFVKLIQEMKSPDCHIFIYNEIEIPEIKNLDNVSWKKQ